MAVRHKRWPLFGVQFHPESFLTQGGTEMLKHFLSVGKSAGDEPREGRDRARRPHAARGRRHGADVCQDRTRGGRLDCEERCNFASQSRYNEVCSEFA